MLKFIICFSVALLTLTTGFINCSSRPPGPSESSQRAVVADQLLVQTSPKEPTPSPEDLKVKGGSDLSIVVQVNQPNPRPPTPSLRHIKLAKNRPTIMNLDLGESIDDQEVTLSFPGNSSEYRMSQRYRTSMSISAEGPHLDLVDWRHFDSPWTPLYPSGSKRFRTLESNQMDYTKFPPTTKSEILKEARRLVGKSWPDLSEYAKGCDGPNDEPCFVMISSIYLRIQRQVRGRWLDTGLVEVRIPMGC